MSKKQLTSSETVGGTRLASSASDQMPLDRLVGGSNEADLLALEPRVLLDAAGAVTGAEIADHAFDAQTERAVDEALSTGGIAPWNSRPSDETQALLDTLGGDAEPLKEIAFIDGGVEGYEALVASFGPDVSILVLDPDTDGVEQIAASLKGQSDIDAVHIVSHGRSGTLDLGSTKLTEASMAGRHVNAMSTIAAALTADADILIYGCDFASNARGASAVEALAAATGADVAASKDLTGNATLGGDWDLEVETGSIEAARVSASMFEGTLAAPPAPTSALPDTINFADGEFRIFVAGNNTDGLGFQDNGFAEIVSTMGGTATIVSNNNEYNVTGSAGPGSAEASTVTFPNATATFSTNQSGLTTAEFRTTTASGFFSGDTGEGIYVNPERSSNASYDVDIAFTTPVNAFSFDIVDAFDTIPTGNPVWDYAVYADGDLLVTLRGAFFGDDATGSVQVVSADGTVQGTVGAGQNIENTISFVTAQEVNGITVRHSLVSGSVSPGARDPHGIDGVVFSTDIPPTDTDGDGVSDDIDIDDDNDGVLDVLETEGAQSLEAVAVSTDWTSFSATQMVGTMAVGGQSVTVTADGNVNQFQVNGALGKTNTDGTFSGFSNGSIFTPSLAQSDSVGAVFSGGSDFSFDFGGVTLVNPTFHVADVDNARVYDFGAPIEIVSQSGGLTLNADGRGFSSATLGEGGTIRLLGTFDSVTFSQVSGATDTLAFTFLAEGVVNNSVRVDQDADGDGIVDRLDIDSDNDGLTDNIEAQTTDGYIAPSGTGDPANGGDFVDLNRDGFDDNYDTRPVTAATGAATAADTAITPVNSNATAPSSINVQTNTLADYLDTDSDGDGVADNNENGLGQTAVVNGTASDSSTDADGDGLFDQYETAIDGNANDGFVVNEGVSNPAASGSAYLPDEDADVIGATPLNYDLDYRDATVTPDTDGDGIFDDVDVDDDNDGILDTVEGFSTSSQPTFSSPVWEVNVYNHTTHVPGLSNPIPVDDQFGLTLNDGTTVLVASGGMEEFPGEARIEWYNGGASTLLQTLNNNGGNVALIGGTPITVPFIVEHIMQFDESNAGFYDIITQNGTTDDGFMAVKVAADGTETVLIANALFSTATPALFQVQFAAGDQLKLINNEYGAVNQGLNIDIGASAATPSGDAQTFTSGLDTDGDGILDHLDLDSDNDGITDNIEAQTTDGYVAPSGVVGTPAFVDLNQDGLDDNYDTRTVDATTAAATEVDGGGLTPVNTDATDPSSLGITTDAVADYLDTDSDGDGISDNAENGLGQTEIASGTLSDAATDVDGDGLFDQYETAIDGNANDGFVVNEGVSNPAASGSAYLPDEDADVIGATPLNYDLDYRDATVTPDTDGDGIFDDVDVDDDNDGILDIIEQPSQFDGQFDITPLDITQANLTTFTDAGTANGLGDTALYSNVATVNGQAVNLLLTVEAIDSSSINVNIAGFTAGEYFPIILSGSDTSSGVSLSIEYLDAISGLPVEVPAGLTFRDIDNTGSGEAVQILMDEVDGYTLSKTPTSNISAQFNDSSFITGQEGAYLSFDSNTSGNPSSQNLWASVNVGAASRIDFNVLKRTGSTGYSFQPTAFTDPTSFAFDYDGDGLLDSLDIDADNDGITDNIEAQTTDDYIAPSGAGAAMVDANKDGFDDYYDTRSLINGGAGLNLGDAAATAAETLVTPVNTDVAGTTGVTYTPDGIADYLDGDSDGDGISDNDENGLGQSEVPFTTASTSANDADGDGLLDQYETAIDGNTNDGFVVNEGVADPLTAAVNANGYLPDGGDAIDGAVVPLTADLDYRDVTQDNTAPTSTGGTVTFVEDVAYAFTAADLNFADTDSGDVLASVRIDTLPATGTLLLNTIAVTALDVINAADISNLAFVPLTNESGANYTSFTYSVNDGTAFSDAPATMTIDGTPANDAPIPVIDPVVEGDTFAYAGGTVDTPLLVVSTTDRLDPPTLTVGQLMAGLGITDIEDNAFGIGVTRAQEGSGVWQYQRTDIANHPWTDFEPNDLGNSSDGAIPLGKVLLLSSQTQIRFIADDGFTGLVELEYRVWDQTVGTASNPPSTIADDSGAGGAADTSSLSADSILVAAMLIDNDTDGDGIIDAEDIDDDNDGILDEVECASFDTTTDPLNPSLYTTETDLSGSLPLTGLAPIQGNALTFDATLNGSAAWVGGVELTTGFGLSEIVSVQPDNTDFQNGDTAVYSMSFDQDVTDFSMVFGGINNQDTARFQAFRDGVEVPLTSANFLNIDPNLVEVEPNTYSTTASNGGFNPTVNDLQLTIAGPIDEVRVTTGKYNISSATVTLGFHSLAYTNFADTDNDGLADHLDIDSDNDGITDNVEAQTTAGYIAPSGVGALMGDADGDGLDDAYDATPNGTSDGAGSVGLIPVNTDSAAAGGGDTVADYLDPDSDDDGILDAAERGDGGPTAAASGLSNATTDTDGDGLFNVFEGGNANDGFDVNDENRDASSLNLEAAATVNAGGTNAVPFTADLSFRDTPDAPTMSLDPNNDGGTAGDTSDDGPDDGGYETTYTENEPGIAIVDSDFTITDPEDDIVEFVVTLTNGQIGDTFNLPSVLPGGVSVAVLPIATLTAPGPMTVTLTGTNATTAADWQSIIQSIELTPSTNDVHNPDPTQRVITIEATDTEMLSSGVLTSLINVVPVNDPPTLDLDDDNSSGINAGNSRDAFVEDGPDAAISSGALISDLDDANLESMTIVLTNGMVDDVLNVGALPTGISLVGAAPTALTADGPLTVELTGVASLSDYQDAIAAITFSTASQDPDTTEREIEVTGFDGEDNSPTRTAFISVTPVNDAPIPIDPAGDPLVPADVMPGQPGADASALTPFAVAPFFNDVDDDNTALNFTLGTETPSWMSLNANGEIVGTPPSDASQLTNVTGGTNGVYEVTVIATDPAGLTGETTVTYTITNPLPDAIDDAFLATENGPDVTGNVLNANPTTADFDPDGDTISVTEINNNAAFLGASVAGDQGGLFRVFGSGDFIFENNGDFEDLADGETRDTVISYTISDGEGGTDTANVTVTVQGTNDDPVVVTPLRNQAYVDGEVITFPTAAAFNDVDGTDVLTYTATNLPAGLSIDPNTGVVSGTIDNSASQSSGQSSIQGRYRVFVTADDGNGGTVTDQVTFNVSNPVPVAQDDAVTTDEDSTTAFNAITDDNGNGVDSDTLPDSDDLIISQVNSDPALVGTAVPGDNGGTLTINADGSTVFDPGADFQYLDNTETATTSVTYQVSDGEGGLDEATITVTVSGSNDAPIPIDPTDPTGPTDPNDYIPEQSGFDSAPLTAFDTSPYFDDVDTSDTLTFAATGIPTWLSIDPTSGEITGTPPSDASDGGPASDGRYPFTITVSDGDETFSTTIVYTIANLPPVAEDDTLTGDEDTVVNASLFDPNGTATGDIDPDGDVITVTRVLSSAAEGDLSSLADGTGVGSAIEGTNGGLFTVLADGTVTFDPGNDFQSLLPGETALTQIVYQISDGGDVGDTAVVSYTVTGLNDAPIPVDPTQPVISDPTDPGAPPTDPDDPRAEPLDPQDYIPQQTE
ncbi:MAG: DUF4347 domain-containing protein, partial [Pseudomonadota bacterium]